jgi:fimbrial chaperone protein
MTSVFLSRARRFLIASFVLAGALPAFSMQVHPLVLDMVSIGAHARGTLEIVNDSAAPVPVEVSIKKLDISLDGKTSESPAGDEFVVFPPQAVVPAGATQSFRIQWVGEPDIKKSQSYMVYVSQLPVKRKAGESGVQIVFNFGAIVSVAPAGAQSALKLVSAEAATESGKRGAAITVENPSAMYSYFSDSKLELEGGGWRKSLGGGELRQLIGYGVVLPGKKRRFFVPIEDAPSGGISANLRYTPKTAK